MSGLVAFGDAAKYTPVGCAVRKRLISRARLNAGNFEYPLRVHVCKAQQLYMDAG
jgi:hypothetical protein